MKIAFEFWQSVRTDQRCVVEIDVPDAYASDPYLPDSMASAHYRAMSDAMPWRETGRSIERSGNHRVTDASQAQN